MIADTVPRRCKRLRTESSVGPIQGGLATLRCCRGPALFRFEPPSGLVLLFLLPRLFPMTFLKGRSGFFCHLGTPAMISGGRGPGPAAHSPRHTPAPSDASDDASRAG